MAIFSLVLVVTIGWTFFMGFMVGREQNPAQRVEQMAAILQDPSSINEKTPAATPAESPNAPDAKAEGGQKTALPETPTPSGIAADETKNSAPDAASTKKKPDGPIVFDPLSHPENSALDAWGIREAPAGSDSAQSGTKTAEKEPQFDWIFQMATFLDKADVSRVQAQLERAGYRVSSTRSGKMTQVLVQLRGGEAEAVRMLEQARKSRLGAPVLRSKKPLAAKKRKH